MRIHLKARLREDGEFFGIASPERDPELEYLRRLYTHEFRLAFETAAAKLDAGERNALRAQYVHRLGIDAIANLLGIHRATAARRVANARERLLGETLAKALFFGGVTRRFPRLRIGLLEAGAAWGVGVYRQLCDAFGRRSRRAIQRGNPALLDREEFHRYWREYGAELWRDREYSKDELATLAFGCLASASEQPNDVDDFALAGVENEHDIHDRFVNNFWFGTGPDDPSVASAFNVRDNPLGAELRPIWGTDLGHWDAPDSSEALADTRELVERGILSEDQFAKVVFSNPHAFYTDLAPDFFQGTTLESKSLRAEPPT